MSLARLANEWTQVLGSPARHPKKSEALIVATKSEIREAAHPRMVEYFVDH